MPHRFKIPQSHLARGPDGRSDFRRLLDQLASQRYLATLAGVLVGLERDRPLFKTVHGLCRVQVPAIFRRSDNSLDANHACRASQAKTPHRRSGTRV